MKFRAIIAHMPVISVGVGTRRPYWPSSNDYGVLFEWIFGVVGESLWIVKYQRRKLGTMWNALSILYLTGIIGGPAITALNKAGFLN